MFRKLRLETNGETLKTFNKKAFIIATLRRASYRYPSRNEALKRARVSRGLYLCNYCKKVFPRKEIKVDHVIPVVGIEGFVSWDVYIDRMYPEPEGFQVLCKADHDIKTKMENQARKLHKNKLTNNPQTVKVRKRKKAK